ncbi:MAG TPA: LemA family protein [Methylophilus sp.]|nr:LemA family protein [Methylophilus sp.]
MGFIFLGIIFVVAIYAVMTYNSLIEIKNNVDKAWSNIDVLLKQRHEEIPKLVAVCKEYMKFEQETLEKVIQARSRVMEASTAHNTAALGQAESALRQSLGGLFALAESYPDLKSNEQFMHLQQRISGLENTIADRREFYNDSVNINNVRIAQFPDAIIANLFGFKRSELLKFSAGETADVDLGKLFESK